MNTVGALAQLGARIAGSDEVAGSSPVCSTIANTEVERPLFYSNMIDIRHYGD